MKTRPDRLLLSALFSISLGGAVWAGCSTPALRSQSPEEEETSAPDVKLIGDFTQAYGMNYLKVEGVGLATGLDGTGSDPAPTPQRAALLAEMQRHKVESPGTVLSSPDTALVLVRGFLRPGLQKGDRVDIEVRVPSKSDDESLRDGWLLETRLTEMAVLGNQIRSGHLLALAQGPVLVDPTAKGKKDRPLLTQGRVLGGGISLTSRQLGLVIHDEHRSVGVSKRIGDAVNGRFHVYQRGSKQGVANAKTDGFVELALHPRYKDNVSRYMQVVRGIPYYETTQQRIDRMALLERQLADPVTAGMAALRLEGIGKESIDILKRGIQSDDPEVRFHAAESLAYLDQTEAAEPLAVIVKNEPAFRVAALAALGAMDDVAAHDELRQLLSATSAETRYGAFRALTAMNPNDPAIRGETLGGQFSYHILDVEGPAMVHVTRSYRPEVVLFGVNQSFTLPLSVDAGKRIMVNSTADGRATVSSFSVGKPDQQRIVSRKIDDVIRAIVELGGTYPDVVQALAEAKEAGALPSRFKVDALPEAGRSFRRETHEEQLAGEAE